jgi:dihydrofolate synthase/folylpolyglutamate synthase
MKKPVTYADTLEFIYSRLPMYQRIGPSAYKKDLTNTLALCEMAGNPQEKLTTVHIAGTNGKGTTTHIIAGGLQAQGYKTGVYTSPHYIDYRERIKINGLYIPKKYVTGFIQRYYDPILEIEPSFFELSVALAFSWFLEEQTDIAVIETGLGGRLDSTNIITPVLSVITNISFDHQAMLGNTLEAIAGEKAGIIKADVPVIIGEKQPSVISVFTQKAKEVQAPLYFAEDMVTLSKTDSGFLSDTYDVFMDKKLWIKGLKTDLTGPFQSKNLITGLCALHHLSERFPVSPEKLCTFFPSLKKSTGYMGRWQISGTNPLIIADAAHNEGGLSIIMHEIKKMPFAQLHIVFGMVQDKDAAPVLHLLPQQARYYFAKANVPRGRNAEELRTEAYSYGLYGKSYSSVRKAFAAAKSCARPDDIILVCGSIFVVAEVLK